MIRNVKELPTSGTAVLLLSGGADSALAALTLVRQGIQVVGLSIDFPGRPAHETTATLRITELLKLSDLITISVPLFTPTDNMRAPRDYEGWIPYKNILFISLAANVAACRSAALVALGVIPSDGTTYNDSTTAYFENLEQLLETSGNPSAPSLRLALPLISLSASEHALLTADNLAKRCLEVTWSCWRNGDSPCGECVKCVERRAFLMNTRSI